ncbi:hypothetical protein H4219_004860 [Mycoemilia scoparia]|uniref:Amino acid transporter transmembrane domain-containing protein n=1 Tax=Mycoemilia scoparia TaxID=417184 RepID=A0A9W7ZW25_9FUNG|nr:hypothetical protein H4219_004860 [Mycoemilia scoparia]
MNSLGDKEVKSLDEKHDSKELDGASGSYLEASTTSDDNDFDPEHNLPRNAGFMSAFSNVICIIIGTGCLQIPYAFAKTGWIGVIIIVISAFIGMYTGNLTIKCLYYKPGHRLHSFPDIGQAAFGRIGRYFTLFFNYLYSLGTTCLYLILAGQFINQLLVTLNVDLGKRIWIVICGVVVWIPVVIVKNMSEVAILALFGFLASVVVIIFSVIQSFRFPDINAHHDPAIGVGIPVALSSIVFSFAGTIVYPHVEASMKKPKQWPYVVISAMVVCCSLYVLIGVVGYWAYGTTVKSPILDTIPSGPLTTIAIILITLHVLLAAPIMLMSYFLETERMLNLKKRWKWSIYRTVVVIALTGISCAIPYFSDFLSLIGALATTTMFCIVPIIGYLRLYGWRRVSWYEMLWMAIVLAIGLVGCVWGSIDAIKALVNDVQNDKNH